MRRPALLLSLVFLPLSAAQAQQIAVRGVVRDSADAPVAYAVVEIEGSGRRFSADADGRYYVERLAAGTWTLRASAFGYAEAERVVVVADTARATRFVDFTLSARPLDLEELSVSGRRARPVEEEPVGAPPARLDRARILATPTAFETDVLQAVQTLPAVANASDFSSALYVRGGTPDQTIVLLDGTPLFNPYHLGGLFSAIDAGLVEDVVAHVGPTSAALGDRLGGVVEINSRAPPSARPRAWGNVSLVSTSAGVSAPLGDGGYTVAARHTYVDVATSLAARAGLMRRAFPYGFSDAYLHGRQRIAGGELRASGYLDFEHVSTPGRELLNSDLEFDWGTGAASFMWEGSLGPHTALRGGLGYSRFVGDFVGFEMDSVVPALEARLVNELLRPSVDLLWLTGRLELRAGTAVERWGFRHRSRTTDGFFERHFPPADARSTMTTLAGHAEASWRSVSGAFGWRAGLRALAVEGESATLMPRVGVDRRLGGGVTLFASAGRKAQAVRSLRSEEAVYSSIFAYDVLTPVRGAPAIADEIAGGIDWQPRPSASLRVEAYARAGRDVAISPVPGNIYFSPLLQPEQTRAEDDAAGLEVSGSWRRGGTEAWLAYSGSWLRRAVDGESFVPRYHRTHHLQLLGAQSISGRTLLSASLQLGSGQRYSRLLAPHRPLRFDPVTGEWGPGLPQIILEERNASRLPFYVRFDVGLRSSFTPRMFGRDVTLAPYISVLNAFAYRNSLYTYYDVSPPDFINPTTEVLETHAPQMPLLPTFGMEWRF